MDSKALNVQGSKDQHKNDAGLMEVTIPALDTNPNANFQNGQKRPFNRACTLRITPSGQCSAKIEDDDLERSSVEDEIRVDSEIEASSIESSSGKWRRTLEDLFLHVFLWLRHQDIDKNIDAREDVLAKYHKVYLYGVVPTTVRIRTAIRTGNLGQILLFLEFFAALVSVVAYARSTYTMGMSQWIMITRKACGVFFAADCLLKLYSAPVRLYYICSFTGLVDFISTTTVIFLWSGLKNDAAIPQMILLIRALRILPTLTSFGFVGGPIVQQIFLLIMYTMGAVFIAAGILQWVEREAMTAEIKERNNCGDKGCLSFYDAFYFIVVTITTVGYGDFTPKTTWGRFVTLCVIIAAILILPVHINNILQLASRRPYGREFTKRRSVDFIILSGNISFHIVQDFLLGFYHSDHAKDMAAFPIRVAILAPFKPSFEIKTLLTNYGGRVDFIEGAPVKDSDLDRIGAKFASAFILLADRNAKDIGAEDAAQITRTLAVHRHCGPNVRVIVEMLKPENQDNAIWDGTDKGIEIICPESIRFQLLSRSCNIQGFSTFVINLFRSGLVIKRLAQNHWMTEYCNGLQQEVFPVLLPSSFYREKLYFEEAAEIIYIKYNAILFGLDMVMEDGSRGVLISPRGHQILDSDVGLVIAKDVSIAGSISKFGKMPSKKCANLTDLPCNTKESQVDDYGILQKVQRRQMQEEKPSIRQHKMLKECQKHGIPSLYEQHSQRREDTSNSLKERCNEDVEKVKLVSSLEDAIDIAMSWPPCQKRDKPNPAVLGRRLSIIMKNLKERTLHVVTLISPHILVCIGGEWPVNLFYFVANLRTTIMPEPPIVILHPNEPDAKQWGCVGMFKDVFMVKGSPLYELDLVRAGVLQAEKVVILAQDLRDAETNGNGDDAPNPSLSASVNTVDVNNLIVAANVERLLPLRGRLMVEVQQEIQLQFLKPYFKTDALHFETNMRSKHYHAHFQYVPPYIMGKGMCSAAFTFLLYSTFFNRSTIDIIHQLSCGRSTKLSDAVSSYTRKLEQIPLPNHYLGQTFKDLFVGLLVQEKWVALGLYRPPGTHGSSIPYVYTNPAFDVELLVGDLVFVLQ